MTAMMKDPATPLRTRIGLHCFFLAHMTVFGTLTFHLGYHVQHGDMYAVGIIPIIIYVFFYLLIFGVDAILWLVITGVLGLLMIHGWLETLALLFIPEPGTVGKWIITDFKNFPTSRHILPGMFLVMYEFTLRNLLIDLLGARHNPHRNRLAGWLFVAISGMQIVLARYV